MPTLHGGQRGAITRVFQPDMPVLRGEADSTAGPSAHYGAGMQGASPSGVARLADVWPLRSDYARDGAGRALHWPGKGHGVRGPDVGENPLSMDEAITWVRDEYAARYAVGLAAGRVAGVPVCS